MLIERRSGADHAETEVEESLRLGTIAGIRIGVNWSVLAIFALLVLGLSVGSFPTLYPGHSRSAYILAGALAASVFLGSLLVHELAHAVVARREGLTVEGITLWLFGGVTRLSGDASTPGAELRIAAVGPLASLALGAGFGVLSLAASAVDLPGIAVGTLSWLALINVVLAIFNLAPGAPLDGGRILRALLWRRGGDRTRAAVSAARAGRGFGLTLAGLGIAMVLLVRSIGGLWLALIGWYIASAARMEEHQARVRGSLQDLRVGDVMSQDPRTVPVEQSVADLLDRHVMRHRHSSYPVTDRDGQLCGFVTLAQIRQVPPERRASTPVAQITIPLDRVAQAHPSDQLLDVLPGLTPTGEGRILVVDEGRPVGIIAASDITRSLDLAQLLSSRS
jgi:Zn-dependent protease/predicted transcriptional regulator